MAENYNNLIFEIKDGLSLVTINRPKVLNALNTELLDELTDVFTRIHLAEEVGAAILTGADRAFVAGADIAQMNELNITDIREMAKKGQEVMNLIENVEKPVIAAVNGFALGGGCELAMACDIRFASDKAKFGQPEVNLGIFPFFGGTQRLPRIVGKGMAKYLIYSAEIIDAAEALRIGLVEKVFPAADLMAESEKFARLIMTKAPIAVKMSKVAVNNGVNVDMKSGLVMEVEAAVSTYCSEDKREGMKAFLEKRPAVFRNK